jgi:hypothetical protein
MTDVSPQVRRIIDRLRAVRAALDLSAAPNRKGWLMTAAAICWRPPRFPYRTGSSGGSCSA